MNKLMRPKERLSSSLLWFTALASLAVSPAIAQVQPMAVPPSAVANQPKRALPVTKTPTKPETSVVRTPKVGPDTLAPSNPDFKADQPETAQQAPAPAPLPPAVWDVQSAEELLAYINQIGGDGLNPEDYDPEGLQAAIQSGDIAAMSAAATERFDLVSSDLALGHVKKPARIDWYLIDKDLDAAKQDALLRSALAAHDIPGALNGLLPTHPQYAALKAALAATPDDQAERDRIRLNMDRWRWLPRDLGDKYI